MWAAFVQIIADFMFLHSYGPEELEIRKARRDVEAGRVERVSQPGRWVVFKRDGRVFTERQGLVR